MAESVCAPATVGVSVAISCHEGLLALAARYNSNLSADGVVQAQIVASTLTVLPASRLVPSSVDTLSRSTDSSTW